MIAPERILALALGELDDSEASEVEEHVLSCGSCAAKLERWLDLGDAVADLVRRGKVGFALTPDLAVDLEERGLITRAYRVPAGGGVACTVDAEDVYVASTLEAHFDGVTRVDVVETSPRGTNRLVDVPFDASRGVVSYVARADLLRAAPSCRIEFTLIAVDPAAERVLGTYVFNHTAFAGR